MMPPWLAANDGNLLTNDTTPNASPALPFMEGLADEKRGHGQWP